MSLKSLATFRQRVRPHTILQNFYLRTFITPINILKHFWAQMLYVTTVIQVIQMPQVIVPSVCSHLVVTKLPSLLSAPMQPSIIVDPDTHGYEWIRWIRRVFTQSTEASDMHQTVIPHSPCDRSMFPYYKNYGATPGTVWLFYYSHF